MFMSMSVLNPVAGATSAPTTPKPAPQAVQQQPTPATLKPDTVSISSTAPAASQAGDVDHDGDSH